MLKYEIVANELRRMIVDGSYPINSQLPIEKDIMEQFSVSRITVKRAFDILVEEGLVIRRRGKGSFVKNIDEKTALLFARSKQFLGFSNNYRTGIETFVNKFEVKLPSEDVQKKLKIDPDDWVYYFVRIRYHDDEPIVIEYTYMSMERIPGITMQILESSIYDYVETKLDLVIQSAHRIITARRSNAEERELLKIQDGVPVVNVEEVTFLDNGLPFSYTQNVHSGDKYQYVSIANK